LPSGETTRRLVGLVKEPLFHFVIAGALLFAAYALLHRGEPAASARPEPVRIGEGEINWLRETFAGQWRRPPAIDELNGLVQNLVEEELLAREALVLGLDKNDTIVRRRLAQKLTFLIDDTARVVEPGDDELRRYYAANHERFQSPGSVSFSQLFFDPGRRPHAEADAEIALMSISTAGVPAVSANIGDPILVEGEFHDADELTISNLFGSDFAKAVFTLKRGEWSGPIRSGYGLHLVRVTNVCQASLRPFEEVRAKVLDEWRSRQERDAKAVYLGKLREKYGVDIDDSVKALLSPSTAEGRAQ
jgi:hypothetical protein